MKGCLETAFGLFMVVLFIFAVGIPMYKMGRWVVTRGECVERAPFKAGVEEIASIAGTYCAKWKNEHR